MTTYESLYKLHRDQAATLAFAHFYPLKVEMKSDYDEPFKIVARQTIDGINNWAFHQERFKNKYPKHCGP